MEPILTTTTRQSVHRVLTALQKKQLCEVKEGSENMTQAKLIEYATHEFGITPSMSQINRMLQNKEQFLSIQNQEGSRIRDRGAKWSELEAAMAGWLIQIEIKKCILYCFKKVSYSKLGKKGFTSIFTVKRSVESHMQMKKQGVSVSGTAIASKAKEVADILGISTFSCSGGWLTNFKHRQSMRSNQLNEIHDAPADPDRSQAMPQADRQASKRAADFQEVIRDSKTRASSCRGTAVTDLQEDILRSPERAKDVAGIPGCAIAPGRLPDPATDPKFALGIPVPAAHGPIAEVNSNYCHSTNESEWNVAGQTMTSMLSKDSQVFGTTPADLVHRPHLPPGSHPP